MAACVRKRGSVVVRVDTLPRRFERHGRSDTITYAVPPGAAAAREGEVRALYSASFMGIGIAKGSLSIKVDRGAYAAKLHISTAGLAHIVSSESYIDARAMSVAHWCRPPTS